MSNWMKGAAIAVASAAVTLAASQMLRTPPTEQAADTAVVRTAGGTPARTGIWQAIGTAHWNLQDHQARGGPVLELGAAFAVPAGVGVVEDGGIPYQPWAADRQTENFDNWLTRDPEVKCYLPGIPRANYMDKPFQIFHSDKAVFIAYEFAGAVRNVFLEEPDPAPAQSWMGQSYGRWEGDTFVVEVTDQLPTTWLDRSGNIKGEDTKIVERWTPTSDFTMRYEAEISDPSVYTKPWKIGFNLYKATGEDAQLQQFKCVEFVEELMYGHLRKNPLPGPALERATREAEERAAEEAELGE